MLSCLCSLVEFRCILIAVRAGFGWPMTGWDGVWVFILAFLFNTSGTLCILCGVGNNVGLYFFPHLPNLASFYKMTHVDQNTVEFDWKLVNNKRNRKHFRRPFKINKPVYFAILFLTMHYYMLCCSLLFTVRLLPMTLSEQICNTHLGCHVPVEPLLYSLIGCTAIDVNYKRYGRCFILSFIRSWPTIWEPGICIIL